MNDQYDFVGWATRNDIRCTDGRVIRRDAFKHNDGKTVPLVWNHDHNDPSNVLGHALLKNTPDGVLAYASLNNSERAQYAKDLITHGDIACLSIWANQLKQNKSTGDVLHGDIKEVSLVLAGANPGATIEEIIAHGEEVDDEAIITLNVSYDDTDYELEHSDGNKKPDDKKDGESKDKTIGDILNTLTEEQMDAVSYVVGMALEEDVNDQDDDDDVDEEEEGKMKHNLFEGNETHEDFISHSDEVSIINDAKNNNTTLQAALKDFIESNSLSHDATAGGFTTEDISKLFPEYKEIRPGAPELITDDQTWVSTVLSKVRKSPMSRIRTSQVDIRRVTEEHENLRAHGYKKGKEKKLAGNFNLVRRTTDPTTVYVRNALHRDDITDITDFDYVKYLYDIDRMQLNEELATAIMIGDGREEMAEDKIAEDKIRPIYTDDDLYTIHVDIDLEKTKNELQGTNTGAYFGANFIMAESMINTLLYAREDYKGTGTPDFFCTQRVLNTMLLARDMNGRRIYNTVAELASALNVNNIYTVDAFTGKTRKDKGQKEHKLLAIVCNLADYALGSTKGGEITHFTQFDIKFNQQLSLLETRCSGALHRVYSAIAIEEPVGE